MNFKRKLQRRKAKAKCQDMTREEAEALVAKVQGRTPGKITDAIVGFCEDLCPGIEPRFLRVEVPQGAELLDCFMIVQRQVAAHEGELVVGWSIWQVDEVLLEAERHGVWRQTDGSLVDLTPKANGAQTSLFVEEVGSGYDGRQVRSRFKKLVEMPELDEFIACADAIYEFVNRGERADQHGELRLVDPAEQEEWQALQFQKGKTTFELALAVAGMKY